MMNQPFLVGLVALSLTSWIGTLALAEHQKSASIGTNITASNSKESRAGETRIALTSSAAYGGIKAKAKYKNRGGERELEVEVENLKVGTMISVCLANARVGGAKTNSLGEARLNLNSDNRQSVPNVGKGTRIEVRVGATCGGALIASGSF
jgi:hypothetical protein